MRKIQSSIVSYFIGNCAMLEKQDNVHAAVAASIG
jgi:hypothetical protein